MIMNHRVAFATIVATLALCCRLPAQTTLDFQFNNTPNSLGTPPIVGTGTFTFATDPGDGTFPIADLGAFSLGFTFTDGDSYNQTDITSVLSEVLVVLSGSGSTRRLQFDDSGSGNTGSGGPYNGSLDLTSGSSELSFEPLFFAGGLLQEYYEGPSAGSTTLGDYLATGSGSGSVPDGGSSFWLLGIGCLALGIASVRRPRLASPFLP
jgi:hypothetical protein